MEILDKSIIVEVDKKVAISFNKKYKDLDLKEVKREITDYLLCHKDKYKDKKVFAFIYDYDSNIAVTVMKELKQQEKLEGVGV